MSFDWLNKKDNISVESKTFGEKLNSLFKIVESIWLTTWCHQSLEYKITNDDMKELWFKTTFPLISVYPIDWKWPFICVNRTPRATDIWTIYSNDETEMFPFYPKTKEDIILVMKFV